MLIATWQCASPAGDVSAGLAIIDRALQQAAGVRAEMVVLPELILPGYNSYAGGAFDTEGTIAEVAVIARRHGTAVTFGLPEVTAGGVFNAAVALGADGAERARYRKVQRFGPRERALFTPGDRLAAFDYRGHRFGLLICYDVEFPEHTRALAAAGCRTLLVPTANMEPHAAVNHVLVPARAMESGLSIAYANYCGAEGDLTYVGRSLIAGPDGPPLACRGTGEGMILADVSELSLGGAPVSTQLSDRRAVSGLDVNGVAS